MSKKRKYEYPLNYYAPSGDPNQLRKVVKARFSILSSLELLQMLDALIEETPQNKALVTLLFLLTERLTYGEYGLSQIDEVFEKEVIPLAQKIEDISSKITTREITQNIVNRIIPDSIDNNTGDDFTDELKQLKDILRDASVKLTDNDDIADDVTIKDLIESSNDSDDWIEKITKALDKSFKDNDLAGEVKNRLHDKGNYETKKIEDKDYDGYLKFINLIFNDPEPDDNPSNDLLNTYEIKQILDSFNIPIELSENVEDHEIKPNEGNIKSDEKDEPFEKEETS